MPVDPNRVGSFLENTLKQKNKAPIYYSTLVSQFGLPELDGTWASHPLCEIFEVLDQQDAATNRPFRTSVVIGKSSNLPGLGLYEALERLKGIPDPKTPKARLQLWLSELKDAYAYPW